MSPGEIEAAARDLLEAERAGRQIGLLSLRHPGMTLGDAYAVQAALMREKLAAGRRVIGWKIGLTSRAMQQALGIETPDSGVLFDDMAFADGAEIPAGRFIQPRIEAEIAFVLKADLGREGVTREEVLAATNFVTPALEILDTRILRADPESGQARIITDTVSDNAANAGIVTGAERFDPGKVDLRRVGVIVKRDGAVEETGLGAGVQDDPVTGIVWLANRMGQYGQGMRAGEIILSGSFIRPVECPPGTEIAADFGDFGALSCRFG